MDCQLIIIFIQVDQTSWCYDGVLLPPVIQVKCNVCTSLATRFSLCISKCSIVFLEYFV